MMEHVEAKSATGMLLSDWLGIIGGRALELIKYEAFGVARTHIEVIRIESERHQGPERDQCRDLAASLEAKLAGLAGLRAVATFGGSAWDVERGVTVLARFFGPDAERAARQWAAKGGAA